MTPIHRQILEEDSNIVAYRPAFARMTNNVLAAILLEKTIQLYEANENSAFYKFREMCSHDLYTPGGSWCEELEISKSAFDHALKLIGTKVTTGVSKSDLLATRCPVREAGESHSAYAKRYADAVSKLVLYWTDSYRLTWYVVNTDLLGELMRGAQ